jgi:hypothetical protein
MRKRRISGGQDFCIVCACFVVVAFTCVTPSAQNANAGKDRVASETQKTKAAALSLESDPAAPTMPKRIDVSAPPARAPLGHITKVEKKAVRGLDERPAKSKEQLVARDEIKKSADDVRQEVRLIASDGQGIAFEQRRIAKDQAAEWRRQLRFQLVGNVVRQQKIDDGLDEAKRAAREQARKVAEEARIQALRE